MKAHQTRVRTGPAAAWLLIASLAGCNLAPMYERPQSPSPAAYKEASSPGVAWAEANPRDEAARARWWAAYGDPQLSALEEQVEVSNQGIAAAAANLRQARAAVAAARSALLPTITASPSASRVRPSQTWTSSASASGSGLPPAATSPASSTTPQIVNEFALPVQASYEVDLWRRVGNNVTAATAGAQASAADFATALLSTQAALAQDYFELRALDSERQILDETVTSYRDALSATSSLYRNGIDSEEDVSQAQTQLDSVIAQAEDLGLARSAREHAIAVLVGKAPSELVIPASPLVAPPPAVEAGLPSDLLQRRPDIAAAERRVAAANAQIGIARSAFFPELTLGATAGWESASFSQWFSWPSRFWSVGPQLAGTLFDGGARRAQTESARAAYDAAVAQYRQTVLSAFQSVEDNLAALRILDSEAGEQQTAVASARHLLKLATTRYQTGIDSYLNVVAAQTTLLTNREAEVQIQLRRMSASVSLVMALGGGWDASRLDSPGGAGRGRGGR
jgi:NodT family efflux transporter outer membrane factor (OMF) lipoprotein